MIIISAEDLESGSNLKRIYDHLKRDGLIVYPTDTLYGIGCNFYSLKAQKKIDKIKKRGNIPYSIAISHPKMIRKLVSQSLHSFETFMDNVSSAKMTFLFKLGKNIDKNLVKRSELIGIRIPDSYVFKKLAGYLGFPLITTSINISGEPSLNSPEKIRLLLGKQGISSDVIMIDEGVLPESDGSTIIDMSGNDIKIVRKGDGYLKVQKYMSDHR